MADKIISVRIDVTKIDKSKLFKGEKGTYLDATILYNEEKDVYNNNGMIVQQVSKEEREKGIKGAILGNVRQLIFAANESSPVDNSAASGSGPGLASNVSDDLPF